MIVATVQKTEVFVINAVMCIMSKLEATQVPTKHVSVTKDEQSYVH